MLTAAAFAADAALDTALKNRFGWRIAEVESKDTPAERREKQRVFLAANCDAWKECRIVRSDKDGCRIKLKLSPATAGTIAEFTLDYPLLEEVAGFALSRRTCRVEDADGGKVVFSPELLSPDRVKLRWRCSGKGDTYIISVKRAPADATSEPIPMQRYLGGGDNLMCDEIITDVLPRDTWSSCFEDILGIGRPQLILGRWTDFAYIHLNLAAKAGEYRYRTDFRYLARDPFDRPIETTDYHGRAFSIVQCVDGDGDGKLDLIVSRFINETPRFARNIAKKPGALEFDEAQVMTSLEPKWRYVFADFDGDGTIDAVGGRYHPFAIVFRKGIPGKPGRTPEFEAPRPLGIELPPVYELPDRSSMLSNTSLAFSAADVNGDGKPDLSMLYPRGTVYVALNRGGGEFSPVQTVRVASGEPINSGAYYPNLNWFDINADGVPDFLYNVGFRYRLGEKDRPFTVSKKEVRPAWLEKQLPLDERVPALPGFAITDLDGDGRLLLYQIDNRMNLQRWEFRDGMMHMLAPIKLKAGQRYGCPDASEHDRPYNQILCFDFDGDGKKDLLVNSEHNWRFGYYSYFRNLGNGEFAPEVRLTPNPDTSYLKLVPSPKGKALCVNAKSNLDYLAVDRRKLVSPRQGSVDFIFAPVGTPKLARTLLCCSFFKLDRDGVPRVYQRLRRAYVNSPTLEKLHDTLPPDLALLWLPDGRIRCQVGKNVAVSKDPIPQEEGKYRNFKVSWGQGKTTVTVDGAEVVAMNVSPKKLSDRMHLGSNAWFAVQRDRENGSRWAANPTDFSAPAEGLFEEFGFTDAHGKRQVIDFEKNLGELRYRTHLVYRCTPGVIKQDGVYQLVANFDDYRREWRRDRRNSMYRIPFTQGEVPKFGKAIPLKLEGEKLFISTFRTQYLPVDWDGDGKTELLFVSSGFIKKPHTKLTLYRLNAKGEYRKVDDPEIAKINAAFAIHHDGKAAVANITGDDRPDIVVGSDPGIWIFSRRYLTQKDPVCNVVELELPSGGK